MADERLILWHRWFPSREVSAEERSAIAAWTRQVTGTLQVSGGNLLGTIGASVAASFETDEVVDLLTVALELLEKAEANEPPLSVAFGVAVGAVEEVDDSLLGPAIERAQNYAIRAKPGDLVLDPGAKELAGDHFLLGRQVAAGAGSPRGTTVDRSHPKRADCAEAIAKLGRPILPPVIAAVESDIKESLGAGSARTFVLRGPVGSGASELMTQLERTEKVRVFSLGAAPGGVVPLASLRLALRLRIGSPGDVVDLFGDANAQAAEALGRVAAGELVELEPLANALVALTKSSVSRPWILLSPLALVDGATLAALLRAREIGGDFVLFGRYPVESPLPSPFAALDEPVQEIFLPPLKTGDAKAVARAVLGPTTKDEVVTRVAVLGGDTVIGVLEAARTSIATGDLVLQGKQFVWRTDRRSGADAVDTDTLMTERLELVDGPIRRVLEAICVAPDSSDHELIRNVAKRDAISDADFERGLDVLTREALALGETRPRPASSLMRWRVLSLIPPARSMEIHRFVGEALKERELEHTPQQAELAYYLVEGGLEKEGRPLVASVVERVLAAGYERAARQLSGWLAAVGEMHRESGTSRPTPPPPPPEAHDESPPSSELALEELLEEPEYGLYAPTAKAAKPPIPPPPKKRPPPPPPAALRKKSPSAKPRKKPRSIPKGRSSIKPPKSVEADLSLEDSGDLVLPPGTPTDALDSTELPTQVRAIPQEPDSETTDPAEIDAAIDELLLIDVHEELAPEATRISSAPPESPDSSFVGRAVAAIRERDLKTLDEIIEAAVAGGRNLDAVERVRAVAALARGDLRTARRSLAEASARDSSSKNGNVRHHLAQALLSLREGEPHGGMRSGLAALAASRHRADVRGESAALHAIAACYRALGRSDAAELIEARLRS